MDSTKDVQVTRGETTKTVYFISFKVAQLAETARNDTEWLGELGKDTKMVKPWVGIVVHRTPIEDFDLEGNKTQRVEEIMEENNLTAKGHQVDDITCYIGSIGAYHANGKDATAVSDTTTWHGHAKSNHAAGTAQAGMNVDTATGCGSEMFRLKWRPSRGR
ncbi:hypothetical protein EYZ11_008154 [Aspergillus tanneri]|uniref:Uncharacterized protein n=1 Tax=Aspergillus tanneri TaxID=1220188 RepID=A0A4S3JB98_9EURO|nr:hypothetical protein EYZ11_008154 [Aspergillus tanneri]